MYGPKKLKKCLQLGEISHLVRLPFCVSSPMSLLRSTAGTGSEIGHYPSPHCPSSVITPAPSARRRSLSQTPNARRAKVRVMQSAGRGVPRRTTAAAAQASTLLGGVGWRREWSGTIEAGRRRRITRGRRPDAMGGGLARSGADPAPDSRPSPRARLGPAAGPRGRRKLPADAGRRRERALAPAGKRGEPPRGPFARRAVPVAFPAARSLPCEHSVL